ncbi:hypothetical protein [Mangrovivirga cuniculi]|uniref:DUF4843 domain-containing protein n=1 Tax=Mangrovivirga cuniculi TaxID=2715131 RepID=A0A4D7JPF8_9BACT|nr:hypothetical protein [Mangrovivirga cuniculi]QCK15380.1 hypothetical protein DCC35_11805 [Mangrovivirga cuniculi]
MIKYTRSLFLLILIFLGACEENYNFYQGPAIAHFAKSRYDYYVNSREDSFLLPVYLTKSNSTDKTYTVELVNEETNAELDKDFSFNPNVIIPAGELEGNITIKGSFDNLVPFQYKEVAFKLTNSEGDQSFRNNTKLSIHKFCEYSLQNLSGFYYFKFSESANPYVVSVKDGIAQLIAEDLYAEGYDVRMYITKIDEVTYEVSVPKQVAMPGNDGNIYVKGEGKLNTCGKIKLTQIFLDEENNEIQTTLSEFIKAD